MHHDELAARQAALQKSLSTALLNHQISELESKVQSIQVSKPPTAANGTNGQKAPQPTAVKPATAGEGGMGVGVKEKFAGLGRIDMDSEEKVDALTHDEDIEPEEAEEDDEDDKWRVAVLDASVLIWAPRSVRRLAAKGWELVLPNDAIRTLDLLKKGSSHAAIGARSATRYVEHATRQYKLLSNDPSITVQAGTNYKRGTGIRIQREDEILPITELSELPIPIDDVPRWAANVLSCAGWFARINQAEIGGDEMYGIWPTLFVANPPLAVEALGGEGGRDHHAERGEGYLISQEAERFELALEVLRDEEQEDMSFDSESAGRRGRGRGGKAGAGGGRRGGDGESGRGAGGKGRGGRARHERNDSKARSEEPEREVKILLRRPAPLVEVNAGGDDTSIGGRGSQTQDHPSPTSVPSAVPAGIAMADLKGSPLALPPTLAAAAEPNGHGTKDDTQSDGGRGQGRQEGRNGEEGSRGRGGRRGRGRGRGGRDGGPPSPGRGGFVLLQRPGPPRPPPVDGQIVRPPPPPPGPPSVPPPPPPFHHHRGGHGHGGGGGGPPGGFGHHPHHPHPHNQHQQHPHQHQHHPHNHHGPPNGGPPRHQFRGPPPPEFQPRVLQRPPPPPGPGPGPAPFIPSSGPGHFNHSRPPPPFQPNPHGLPFRPSRSPYDHMDNSYTGARPGFDDRNPTGPKKVVLLQRPKG